MMELFRGKEFGFYFIVGGIATLIDWGMFALGLQVLGQDRYLVCVAFSISLAGTFHYFANKRLTFQCQSRAIGVQIPLYIGVAITGVAMSMAILGMLVSGLGWPAMSARVVTTALMLVPNYLMHKYLTFSKRYFGQSIVD